MPLNREALGADTLTAKRTLELLDKAVEQRGEDWSYPGEGSDCMYFVDEGVEDDFPDQEVGAPACIVGFVLSEIGLTIEDVAEANQGAGVQILVDSYLPNLGLTIDNDAQELLRIAQTEQDTGSTWGQAVSFARDTIGDE